MAKGMDLIFILFNVASAYYEASYDIPQLSVYNAFFMDLWVGYVDYRDTFRIVPDSYCGLYLAENEAQFLIIYFSDDNWYNWGVQYHHFLLMQNMWVNKSI